MVEDPESSPGVVSSTSGAAPSGAAPASATSGASAWVVDCCVADVGTGLLNGEARALGADA